MRVTHRVVYILSCLQWLGCLHSRTTMHMYTCTPSYQIGTRACVPLIMLRPRPASGLTYSRHDSCRSPDPQPVTYPVNLTCAVLVIAPTSSPISNVSSSRHHDSIRMLSTVLLAWSIECVLPDPHPKVVSLHCNLDASTHHLMNASRLKLMKPNAVLVNAARGPVIDEAALVAHLKSNPDFR